jgi:hypothetical protein
MAAVIGLAQGWPWWLGGAAIGLFTIALAWTLGRALGVSSSFGALCSALSGLPYFRQQPFSEPGRLAFLIGMPLGGLASAWLARDLDPKTRIGLFETVWGESALAKVAVLALGGFLVGYGARWAGG